MEPSDLKNEVAQHHGPASHEHHTSPEALTGQVSPYYCPQCKSNRVRFQVISKYSQPVHKDPRTGEISERVAEPHLVTKEGRPDVDVRCEVCNYTAGESIFTAAARNSPI